MLLKINNFAVFYMDVVVFESSDFVMCTEAKSAKSAIGMNDFITRHGVCIGILVHHSAN